MTFIRCSGGRGHDQQLRAGTSSAPPAACSTRAATSSGTDGAVAHSTRPEREAGEPGEEQAPPADHVGVAPARHEQRREDEAVRAEDPDSPASVAPANDARMSGNATLTIVASR